MSAGLQSNGDLNGVGSRRTAFWVFAGTLTLFLFGASAPSPLYGVYQAKFHFSATTLTAVFAVYALALLVTLLPQGDLTDWESYYWREPPPAEAIAQRLGRPHLTWIFVGPFHGGEGIGTASRHV